MGTLEIKKNRSGSLAALHQGQVRVGYVEQHGETRFVWTLNVMQPNGGVATGITNNFGWAYTEACAAFDAWLEAAGLYRF